MVVKEVINMGSGSKGNAYFLMVETESNYAFWEEPKPFGLLIECGFSFQDLSRKLREQSKGRYSLRDVDVVLVTHRHHDHSLSVKALLDVGKKVYAPQEVFEHWKIDVNSVEYKGKAIPLSEGVMKYISPNITVVPFPLEHDEKKNMYEAALKKLEKGDVAEYERMMERLQEHIDNNSITVYGYIITIAEKYNILFFIDTMYLPYDFNKIGYQFDMIFGESNHFPIPTYMAYRNAKETNNYADIKRYERIMYSHMSVETFVRTLNGLDLSKTTNIIGMHTSSSERVTGDEIKYYHHIKNNLKPNHHKDLQIMVCKEKGNFATGGIKK